MSEQFPSPESITRRRAMQAMLSAGLAVAGGTEMLLGSASAQAATEPAPKRGGKIRVAYAGAGVADTMDPARGVAGQDYIRFFMFYSGLTQFDGSLTPQMQLAESISTTDGKVWQIKLKKGVTFHDGKPLTSADVVFSLMRHKLPETASTVKSLVEQISEVKAVSPTEVSITLTDANADLPVILATPQLVITQDGTTDFKKGIGTGPFKLKSFQPGTLTAGVRNENYFKPGLPYLDAIDFIGITDGPSRVNALLSGDVQLVNAIDPRNTKQVQSSSGYAIQETKSGLYTDLAIKRDASVTGSPDFALGMKYLYDREQILKAIFLGYATIANDQPIPPQHRYFNPDVKPRAYDLDKAKYHFQKAGAIGAALPPMYVSNDLNGGADVAVFLQQSAAKIGVNLTVNRVPAAGYWSQHWLKHPMVFGSVNPRPSADVLFTQFFKSDAPWNESNWKNPRFDSLLLAARAETDDAKRKQMYGEMQALVSGQAGIGIPSFISLLDGYDKRLKGLKSIPTGGLMGFCFAEYVWWAA